jgi:hypothetical protein
MMPPLVLMSAWIWCGMSAGMYARPHPHSQLEPPPLLMAGSRHYSERHGSAGYGGSPKASAC